ncbi:MAG: prepilin peptidase [archaeon]
MEFIAWFLIFLITGIAALQDLKTGYVSDNLMHTAILLAIILVPFLYPDNFLNQYGIAFITFIFFFSMYLFGQIGGGDVKVFSFLALLLPQTEFPRIVFVFMNFALFFMAITSVQYLVKILKIRKKVEDFKKKMITGVTYCVLFTPVVLFWAILQPKFLIFGIPLLTSLLIIPFKNDFVKLFFLQEKEIKDLTNDDIIALEVLDEKIKKTLGLNRKTYLDFELKKIKEIARKKGIKTIYVCENMPRAVPYIFLGALTEYFIPGAILLFLR